MLFVDNPVGTGFSYTDRPDGFATNVSTVASDMLVLLQHFFTKKPEFQVCLLSSLYSEAPDETWSAGRKDADHKKDAFMKKKTKLPGTFGVNLK